MQYSVRVGYGNYPLCVLDITHKGVEHPHQPFHAILPDDSLVHRFLSSIYPLNWLAILSLIYPFKLCSSIYEVFTLCQMK